jgi:hypothetical protein
MIQPARVLGFLDVFGIPSGTWDPSLAVVTLPPRGAMSALGVHILDVLNHWYLKGNRFHFWRSRWLVVDITFSNEQTHK